MLIDNVPEWRDDTQFIATEGRRQRVGFSAGPWPRPAVHRDRPGTENAARRTARPTAISRRVPLEIGSGQRRDCRRPPIGPCFVYPNYDTWIDPPYADGVLLIGDAAGRNDPITGQGLSITHRDVRLVRDLLFAGDDWSTAVFASYGAERSERMRRLRISARLTSIMDAEFDADARQRRHACIRSGVRWRRSAWRY